MSACPTPWKKAHPDRPAALAAREHLGQRAYRCDGRGRWHVNGSNRPGRWAATGGRT